MVCQVIQTEMCGYHNYTLDHGSYMLPVAEQLCSTNHDLPYIEHSQQATRPDYSCHGNRVSPLISEPLTGPGSYQLCNTDRSRFDLSPAQAYFCSVQHIQEGGCDYELFFGPCNCHIEEVPLIRREGGWREEGGERGQERRRTGRGGYGRREKGK